MKAINFSICKWFSMHRKLSTYLVTTRAPCYVNTKSINRDALLQNAVCFNANSVAMLSFYIIEFCPPVPPDVFAVVSQRYLAMKYLIGARFWIWNWLERMFLFWSNRFLWLTDVVSFFEINFSLIWIRHVFN